MDILVEVSDYESYSSVYHEFATKEEANKFIKSLQYCIGRIVDKKPLQAK